MSQLEDDPHLEADPSGTLARLRLLGVQEVRVSVRWQQIAPRPDSRRRPAHFAAANPAAYPRGGWATWDAIVRAAAKNGIQVLFDVMGGAPLWATGPGAPKSKAFYQWEPSAAEYGAFVHALGERYSGSYDPKTRRLAPGYKDDLPAVSAWSIWNEPDYGPSLAPQGLPGHLRIDHAPEMYRGLLDAGWSALHQTGHGRDTIMFGELAPRGENRWGVFSGMKPLVFLRSLYCVDSRYRQLRGSTARAQGCPTTSDGSRSFVRQHPALFSASGFADHPYEQASAPNRPTDLCGRSLCVGRSDADFTDLPEIPRLERALDRLNGVYGSRTRFPVWSTEYGFRTRPPDPHEGVSQATAAAYMNWAEFLSYHQSRLFSYSQYKLRDFPPPLYFDTGIENPGGSHKPGYDAYRMPIFLPVTSTRRGRKLEVWGAVRPASYAKLDTGRSQSVQIQFQAGARGAWRTVETVAITNSRGYFDVKLAFPGSGAVRLAWTYPAGDPLLGSGTAHSRTVSVSVS
jgi:hypothetical protein